MFYSSTLGITDNCNSDSIHTMGCNLTETSGLLYAYALMNWFWLSVGWLRRCLVSGSWCSRKLQFTSKLLVWPNLTIAAGCIVKSEKICQRYAETHTRVCASVWVHAQTRTRTHTHLQAQCKAFTSYTTSERRREMIKLFFPFVLCI